MSKSWAEDLIERIRTCPPSALKIELHKEQPPPSGPLPGELEVRCCCNPANVLGWLQVPAASGNHVVVPMIEDLADFDFDNPAPGRPPAKSVYLEISPIVVHGRSYSAVKSMHLPIETFRKIRGFRENKNVAPLENRAPVKRKPEPEVAG